MLNVPDVPPLLVKLNGRFAFTRLTSANSNGAACNATGAATETKTAKKRLFSPGVLNMRNIPLWSPHTLCSIDPFLETITPAVENNFSSPRRSPRDKGLERKKCCLKRKNAAVAAVIFAQGGREFAGTDVPPRKKGRRRTCKHRAAREESNTVRSTQRRA